MRVGILFSRSHAAHLYASNTLAPLLRWRRAIGREGIELVFCSRPCNRILDCDTIIIIDFFEVTGTASSEDLQSLHKLRSHGAKLIYFDNSDSCGTTNFEVINYVDKYLKKQLYRDKSIYGRKVYGLRTYCEFYHNYFGINNTFNELRTPLPPAQEHKLAVGWNSGMGPYRLRNKMLVGLNRYNFLAGIMIKNIITAEILGPLLFSNHKKISWNKRKYDVQYRAYNNFSLDTIVFGRRRAGEELESMKNSLHMRTGKPVSHARYLDEMRQCKVIVSPFGYGEICRRDFEAFCSGGLLVKPDMGHVKTWPPYYENGVTYLAYAWDFSNFHKTIEHGLNGENADLVAAEGERRYLSTINADGKTKFCKRLKELTTFYH